MSVATVKQFNGVFTGSYGVVALLDAATEEQAELLAKEYAPEAEYVLRTAHITGMHAWYRELPEARIRELLERARIEVDHSFMLDAIVPFDGKFLSWNCPHPDTSFLSLQRRQIEFFEEFLDGEAVARALASEEQLTLTNRERAKFEKHGYPFIEELYQPHLMLAWQSAGFSANARKNWQGHVSRIAFAEIGDHGSIQEIIFSVKWSGSIQDHRPKIIVPSAE